MPLAPPPHAFTNIRVYEQKFMFKFKRTRVLNTPLADISAKKVSLFWTAPLLFSCILSLKLLYELKKEIDKEKIINKVIFNFFFSSLSLKIHFMLNFSLKPSVLSKTV